MTAKCVARLAVALLVTGISSDAVAGTDGSIELARGKTEIHLVGFGKITEHGMLSAEIIKQAFERLSVRKGALKIKISWVEDKQLLLNPLLSRKVFDVGFAWEKPDCQRSQQQYLCQKFFFSKPLYSIENKVSGRKIKRTFHAIIAKSHPRARTYLYYLNVALDRLRATGDYRLIVARYGPRFASQQP